MHGKRHLRGAFRFALTAGLLGLGAASQGCGSSGTQQSKGGATQLSADDAQLFERGVDFIGKPEGLEGRWREDWDRDLEQRVHLSDLVALVTVKTLRTDTAPDQRVTHRIAAHVDRVIAGEPRGDELELAAGEGAPGFASVNQAVARMTQEEFVAFVKWAPNAQGEMEAHFHLSPASQEVLAETEARVTRVRPHEVTSAAGGERVIVHTN
jgi:hypothetical protein